MLALSAHLPEVRFEPGEAIVREGGTEGAIWVLVSGALAVRKSAVAVNRVTQPSALVGEISVLLGQPYGATVEASAPSQQRTPPTAVRCWRATPTSPGPWHAGWPSA